MRRALGGGAVLILVTGMAVAGLAYRFRAPPTPSPAPPSHVSDNPSRAVPMPPPVVPPKPPDDAALRGAAEARRVQQEAADSLGMPVTREADLGGGVKMQFLLIPPGSFPMGALESAEGTPRNEKPRHAVTITRPFYLGRYPVTRGQFAAFAAAAHFQTEMEKRGWENATWRNPGFEADQTDDHPAVWLTWNDATRFCEWLSRKEKKTYELPTEAEWEYACRAGTTTAYFFGDDPKVLGDYAWYCNNSQGHTRPVGSKRPNPWGLYDTYGQVFQYCADSWDPAYYQNSPEKDPRNVNKGDARCVRGGAYLGSPAWCTSARRFFARPEGAQNVNGFRVCLRPD